MKEKLQSERADLEAKISELHKIVMGDNFSALSDEEQNRLILQYKIMEAYVLVLEQRIAAI